MIALLRKFSRHRDAIETHVTLVVVAAVIAMYLFNYFPGATSTKLITMDKLLLFGLLFLVAYFFTLFIAGRLQKKDKR